MPKTIPIFKQPIVYVSIIVLFFLAVGINTFVYVNKSKETTPTSSTSTPTSTPSPSPTPSPRPIPHGPIPFTASQSDKTKPVFSKGLIDPYDPEPNALQTVTISVTDIEPVTQVTAILKTDNNTSQPVSFQLVDGSPNDGTWKGSWTVSDTYLYTYNLVLTATSSRGESRVEITLR